LALSIFLDYNKTAAEDLIKVKNAGEFDQGKEKNVRFTVAIVFTAPMPHLL
jgi:hypothetical protein